MPTFAKRHYESIALAMQCAYRDANGNENAKGGVNAAVNELADTFAADNPAFQRGRFIAACVPGANVRARKEPAPLLASYPGR